MVALKKYVFCILFNERNSYLLITINFKTVIHADITNHKIKKTLKLRFFFCKNRNEKYCVKMYLTAVGCMFSAGGCLQYLSQSTDYIK